MPADELSKLNMGFVIEDTAGRQDAVHMKLTTKTVYVRFGAYNHPSDLERLADWSNVVKDWLNRGTERVYFFVHCDDAPGEIPRLIKYFQSQIHT